MLRSDVWLLWATALELLFCWFAFGASMTPVDLVYTAQRLLILWAAVRRLSPVAVDSSRKSVAACAVCYVYGLGVWYLPDVDARAPAVIGTAGGLLLLFGALLSLWGTIALGQSFGVRPALRPLATRGPYAVVRHPIYAGYIVSDLAYVLITLQSLSLIVFAVGWTAIVVRIRLEENVLGMTPAWAKYCRVVRSRLIPFVF